MIKNCIGFELNPDFVQMTRERLRNAFTGFDSTDERMERVPLDLRNDTIREEYLANHIKWFLQHHNGSVDKFAESVEEMYGDKIRKVKQRDKQASLFPIEKEKHITPGLL